MKLLKLIFIGLCFMALNSCTENGDVKAVADAQACLDKATDGPSATVCDQKLGAVDNPQANRIHCGVVFLQQGFTDSTFQNAFTQLKTSTPAGANNTLSAMVFFAFNNNNTFVAPNRTNWQDSAYAQTVCSKANSPGMIFLANTVNTATLLRNCGEGEASATPAPMTTAGAVTTNAHLNAAVTSPCATGAAVEAAIGQAVQNAFNSYCANGSASSSTTCQGIQNAINASGGNLTTLGQKYLACLQTSSC